MRNTRQIQGRQDRRSRAGTQDVRACARVDNKGNPHAAIWHVPGSVLAEQVLTCGTHYSVMMINDQIHSAHSRQSELRIAVFNAALGCLRCLCGEVVWVRRWLLVREVCTFAHGFTNVCRAKWSLYLFSAVVSFSQWMYSVSCRTRMGGIRVQEVKWSVRCSWGIYSVA